VLGDRGRAVGSLDEHTSPVGGVRAAPRDAGVLEAVDQPGYGGGAQTGQLAKAAGGQ
jgi:hypothetical protein